MKLLPAQLTNDCHVGGLCHGKEGWSDGDLAEVSSSQLRLHRVQDDSHVVGGRHLKIDIRNHYSQSYQPATMLDVC